MYSPLSLSETNFPSLPRFMFDGFQHWTSVLPRMCQYPWSPWAFQFPWACGCVRICPEDSLIVFSEMCYSGIDLFSLTLVFGFSSSHNIVADHMIMKFKLFIPLIMSTYIYYTKYNENLKHFEIAYLLQITYLFI